MTATRTLYLAAFRKVLRAEPDSWLEPALRTGDGAVAVEGSLQLGLRLDLVRKEDGTSVVASGVVSPGERQATARVDDVSVLVQAPAWEALRIRLGDCNPRDFSALVRWYGGWFDEEDRSALNEEGFHGVVHFLSDPVVTSGTTTFTADLGSAPLAAFEALVTCLATYRPTRIELGSEKVRG